VLNFVAISTCIYIHSESEKTHGQKTTTTKIEKEKFDIIFKLNNVGGIINFIIYLKKILV